MGENTEELVVSLENSLSSDICDTVGDLAEVGLDAVMDDGILKDIPILSTVPFIHTDFFMEVLICGCFTGKRPEKNLWLRQ